MTIPFRGAGQTERIGEREPSSSCETREAASAPLRVAVFVEYQPGEGGVFQYALSAAELLAHHNTSRHEFLVFTRSEASRRVFADHGIDAVVVKDGILRFLDRWCGTVVGGGILLRLQRRGFRTLGRHLDATLDRHRIDLVLFNDTTEVASRLSDHPFIVTVLDLDHREHPDFPESFTRRLFERNERAYPTTLVRAIAVIANTPSTGRRISELYHVDPKRIVELPFVPSLAVRRHAAGRRRVTAEEVRRTYRLPERFVFYPSWFFPHKNHLYLLEALAALERRHDISLDAVFCGGDPDGHEARVRRQAEALGLGARVRFLGLVPDGALPALYEAAFALAMPSHFGTTNLPPIEAAMLGCPAICADFPVCREQMGEAALYCDLDDSASLAAHLAALVRDPDLVPRLKQAGSQLARRLVAIDYSERLGPVLDNFAELRCLWAWPPDPGTTR